MLTPQGCVEIPLTVFGGNNLELDPTDIPQGLSWGSRDVAFLPGEVFTRPPLVRYSTRSGSTSQLVYTHDYLRPDGTVSRMDCYADGAILCDGVVIANTQPGNRFQMATAFGKVFIAISDGMHGVDVPLQWDGQYLDRVSQDGPGDTCSLANYSLPSVALVAGTTSAAVPVVSATPTNPQTVQVGGGQQNYEEPYEEYGGAPPYNPPVYATYYTSLQVKTTTPHGLTPGISVSLTGNSLYSMSGYVQSVIDATDFTMSVYTQSTTPGTGGTVTASAPFLQRTGNQVASATASPHNLRAGYQVAISGVADQAIGGGVSQIVIDNTAHPGLARVVTASAHGLSPEEDVTITNVPNTAIGGGINTIVVYGDVATVTTNTPHGIQAGASVIIQSGSGPNLQFTVQSILSPTAFSYAQDVADVTQSGNTATLVWPGNQNTTQVYTVDSVDSPTSFFIPFSYSNGTWTGGTLTYAWNGTFFVTSVTSATGFTYRQTGPDLILATGTGTMTPQGQIAPGQRSAVVSFQLRDGTITKPSIKVSVAANGNKSLFVSNLPIGPPNTVARVVSLSGADGGNYFYIPVAPRDTTGTYLIGTATVIPDNTTTSAIFDFADEALFAGIGIDIPGNDLFGLEVLGPCLGFYSYASRLAAWQDTNRVQQFRNMGFEGGTYAGSPNIPLGWTVTGMGTLSPGIYGMGWKITGGGTGTDGTISQPCYLDTFGVPLLKPNTQYTLKMWMSGTGQATVRFGSPSTGVLASAIVTAPSSPGWVRADFNTVTPVAIPSDATLTVFANGLPVGQTVTLDEMQIVYTKTPYLPTARFSYVNNPASFHGETGRLGAADFPLPIRAMELWRGSLCLLTAGPLGALYETQDSESGEPVTWTVQHRGSLCGAMSVWGAAAFEDWFVWASDTGLRIYDGSGVDKVSQEIQSWWDTVNPQASQFSVLANDPYTRRLYLLAPTGTASVPNATYVLDYRELNTASLLASAGTLRVGYSGKMVTTDLTRKWTPWSMTMNYCGMVANAAGSAQMVFCGGTGGQLSDSAQGAGYVLNEGSLTGLDADYGPFWQNSVYPTYFFIASDEAQGLKLGVHRLLHSFASMNVSGNGAVFLQLAANRVDNIKQTTRAVAITPTISRDLEFGLQVGAERVSYIIACQPVGVQPFSPTAQAGFRVSSLTVSVKDHPFSPVRGWNGG